jgi:2-C-methyl-D-erythritol 4-phosphate cytidylyltransferase
MTATRPKVYAIIPAAGAGTRIPGPVRKQFLVLAGKPVLVHTVQRFERCAEVDEVVLAVPEDALAETESLVSRFRLHKVSRVVAGGAQRQDSVYNAVSRLKFRSRDIVLVHDGVRPFIEAAKIQEVIRACRDADAAAVAVQPKDTVRRSTGGDYFDRLLDRSALWLVQTPQAFRAPVLIAAIEKARNEHFVSTDDAALVERMGVKVKVVSGSYDNIKITTQEDLELGGLILDRWRQAGMA